MNLKSGKTALVGTIAALMGLVAGAILMAVTGNNPFAGYTYLFRGGLMNIERIGNTLATATPLILAGLSLAFAFKTGLFNIGAGGQILMGGLCSTMIGLSVTLPKPLLLLVMMLGAIAGGAIWALLAGYLKARFNVHEVVSTIMLNWIAYWIVFYVIPAYFKSSFFDTESKKLPDAASLKVDWMSHLFSGSFINLGLFIAIGAVIVVAIILNRTVLGFELKAVGFNRHAAEYAGINVNRNIVVSMMIAGALAGLAGGTLYAGYTINMQVGVTPSQGIDGIAVALLGGNSPIGVVVSAIFFGILQSGKGFMNAMTKIPPEIGDTIIATIIYFAATSVLIERGVEAVLRRFRRAK